MASFSVPSRFCSCCDCSWRMRRSAISCWCSLLAARAGAAARTIAAASRLARIFCVIDSLCGDHEVGAPVLLVRSLVMAGIERELLAVADGPQPIGRNAERHEVGARRDRAPLSQSEIVLGGPALVAMAFDGHAPRRITLQQRRVFVEHLLAWGAEIAAVELEEHRLQR